MSAADFYRFLSAAALLPEELRILLTDAAEKLSHGERGSAAAAILRAAERNIAAFEEYCGHLVHAGRSTASALRSSDESAERLYEQQHLPPLV